jgi:hypothetical protein
MTLERDGFPCKRYSARTPLPPGYAVVLVGDHWCWIRLADEAESSIHWNHWACWRGAWANYRLIEKEAGHG